MNITQESLKVNDYYSTPDLALATVISLSYPIEVIDKQNPHKALFLFKREQGLERLIEAYWRKELTIEPQAFFGQLKNLKARLYGEG